MTEPAAAIVAMEQLSAIRSAGGSMIITDYLLGQGGHVVHILGSLHFVEASLAPEVVVRQEGTIIYSAESPEED